MLEVHRFTVLTDHDPLTYALCKNSEPWIARQARHLSYTAEFTSDILYVSGSEIIVADTLSRPAAMAPGTVDKGPTEVKVPLGSSVFPNTVGPPTMATVAASEAVLGYRQISANQGSCADTIKTLWTSSLVVQHVLFGYVSVLCREGQPCSRRSRRGLVQEDKRMAFVYTHGLFIT